MEKGGTGCGQREQIIRDMRMRNHLNVYTAISGKKKGKAVDDQNAIICFRMRRWDQKKCYSRILKKYGTVKVVHTEEIFHVLVTACGKFFWK